MHLQLSKLVHPYLYEIAFTQSEVLTFPAYGHCPACATTKKPNVQAEIGSHKWDTRIQFVQCVKCDHLYYSNPPSEEYFTRFYNEQWNAKGGESLSQKPGKLEAPKNVKVNLLDDIGRDQKDMAILDIGCGLGGMLAGLKAAGFNNLYGTEASQYRATTTRSQFPDRIFAGGYESVPDDLTFDFIFSHHVAEHIFNPHEALKWMSQRLNKNGLIAISVPDAWCEPVLHQMLFLPHLHSFCHRSLMMMGKALGLECRFWAGDNIPYEITAVFYRPGTENLNFKKGRWLEPGQSFEDNSRSQSERMGKPFANIPGSTHDLNFALHAGEKGAIKMRQTDGYREMSTPGRALAHLGIPASVIVTKLGMRNFGVKKLGRVRYVHAQITDASPGIPIIEGVDDKAVFHIK